MFVIGLHLNQVPMNCRDGVTRHKPQLRTRNEGSYLFASGTSDSGPCKRRGSEGHVLGLDSLIRFMCPTVKTSAAF
jgi:hypothetical protein